MSSVAAEARQSAGVSDSKIGFRAGHVDLKLWSHVIYVQPPCPEYYRCFARIRNTSTTTITAQLTAAYSTTVHDPDCVSNFYLHLHPSWLDQHPHEDTVEVSLAGNSGRLVLIFLKFVQQCDGETWIKLKVTDKDAPEENVHIDVIKVYCDQIPPASLPTLTEWGFLLLILVMIGSTIVVVRRRRRAVVR